MQRICSGVKKGLRGRKRKIGDCFAELPNCVGATLDESLTRCSFIAIMSQKRRICLVPCRAIRGRGQVGR